MGVRLTTHQALLAGIVEIVNPDWIEGSSMYGDKLDFLWYGILDVIIALFAFGAGFLILQGEKTG